MTPYEKHMAAIQSGRIERSNIIGLRKAFHAYDRASRGYSISRTAPAMSFEQIEALNRAIEKHKPIAAGELHEGGLTVLRNPRYAKRWTMFQRSVIDRIDHFELTGFDWVGRRASHAVPVYRAVARDGQSFAFRNIPWQTAWSLGEEDGPRVVPDDGPDLGEMPRNGMA